jgi:hypothetical protein
VRIESSDDNVRWQMVREGGFLFRVGGPGRTDYEKNTISIPENDMRYLRVTVLNGQGDPRQLAIASVSARRTVTKPAATAPVALSAPVIEQDKGRSRLDFDLGYRHLPLKDLTLDFHEKNFFRHVTVYGRQEEERIVKHAVEDAEPLERTVEVPWRRLRTGVLYRFSAGDKEDASLTVSLAETSYRYVRVEIHNGDDPPLTFRDARASRYVSSIRFPSKSGGTWRVFSGNPRARRPAYDLRHYASRLAARGITQATLGPVDDNPAFGGAPPTVPWLEQHRVLLWIALLAALAVLSWLVLKQMRAAGGSDASS